MKILRKLFYSIGYHFGKGFFNSNQELKNIIKRDNKFDFSLELENEQKEKSYNFFKDYFKNSIFLEGRLNNLNYSVNKSLEKINNNKDILNNKYSFLEFGVFKGETTNYISNIINFYNLKLDAFDSFEGLSEDRKFTKDPKGSYTNSKKIPILNKNVNLITGNIFQTLSPFMKDLDKKVIFTHIDTDTYETTKFILDKIKPYLVPGSIIVFDELHNFMGWEMGEAKALFEVFKKEEFEFLSFSTGQQATVRLK